MEDKDKSYSLDYFEEDNTRPRPQRERPSGTEPRHNRQPQQHRRKKRGFEAMSRDAVNNGVSMISLVFLIPIFFITALLIAVLPHPTESQLENRTLATIPAITAENYFSGEFTSSVAKCYDDRVPNRDPLKNVVNSWTNLFGFQTGDSVKIVGNIKQVNNNSSSKAEETTTANSSTPQGTAEQPTQAPTDKDFTKEEAEASYNNGLISVFQNNHWRALELFGGGSGTSYAEALNQLNSDLGGKVKIYSMPDPLACEYYTPLQYSQYTTSQADCFKEIAAKMNKGITSVSICDVLAKHTEEDIYCRTDHHWQPLGAYYASQTFAATAGVPFADLSTYKKQEIPGFVGTMYAFTGDANILNDPETFTYYQPANKYTTYYYDQSFNFDYEGPLLVETDTDNAYLTFMGGDDHIVKVKTDVTNGRKLCVVKDSYGNAEIPFYTGSFSEIYVLDMRYAEINLEDLITQMGITDVLFTCSSYSTVGENADNLQSLLTQNKGATITDGAVSGSGSSTSSASVTE